MIGLPKDKKAQFDLFLKTCGQLKQLADQIDPALFDAERVKHGVPAPKALDNAIVAYVRSVGGPTAAEG